LGKPEVSRQLIFGEDCAIAGAANAAAATEPAAAAVNRFRLFMRFLPRFADYAITVITD
jgi:hypothetical protein